MMILGLKSKKKHRLVEIISQPNSGKGLLVKACATRTGSSYFQLPELDLTQPIDRCLLASFNNTKALIENPEQWGDIYFAYLKRKEKEILAALEMGDVWVTNYIHTLNLYQKALQANHTYKLSQTPEKVYTDAPAIKSYKYENIDFLGDFKLTTLDFRKKLKTHISFVPTNFVVSTNYKCHPAKYLTVLARDICSKLQFNDHPYIISDEYFTTKTPTESE